MMKVFSNLSRSGGDATRKLFPHHPPSGSAPRSEVHSTQFQQYPLRLVNARTGQICALE